jgi:hypothetical protein
LRAGTAEPGRQRPQVKGGFDGLAGRGAALQPERLMEPVFGCAPQQARITFIEGGQEQAQAAQVENGVVPGHRARQGQTGLVGFGLEFRHPAQDPTRHRNAQPVGQVAGDDMDTTEHRRGGIIAVALYSGHNRIGPALGLGQVETMLELGQHRTGGSGRGGEAEAPTRFEVEVEPDRPGAARPLVGNAGQVTGPARRPLARVGSPGVARERHPDHVEARAQVG